MSDSSSSIVSCSDPFRWDCCSLTLKKTWLVLYRFSFLPCSTELGRWSLGIGKFSPSSECRVCSSHFCSDRIAHTFEIFTHSFKILYIYLWFCWSVTEMSNSTTSPESSGSGTFATNNPGELRTCSPCDFRIFCWKKIALTEMDDVYPSGEFNPRVVTVTLFDCLIL